jgi:hypothetical protein
MQLTSHDTTVAFANVLYEHGVITSSSSMLDFFAKPYKWQQEYDDIMVMISNYYGTDNVHITEAIDVVEIYDKVYDYFYPLQHFS